MEFAERNYGRVFLGTTSVLVLLSMFGLQPGPASTLGLFVAGVVLLGLPHGALDPMVAQQFFRDYRGLLLPLFYATYFALSLLYTLLWWKWPTFGLSSFLVIAAFHFGSDWEGRGSLLSRLAYGFTIVALPAASHPVQVATIYQGLGVARSLPLMHVSVVVALCAGPVAVASAARRWRKGRSDLVEFLCIVAAGLLLQPLLFFVCYFALLHSPRHLLMTARSVGISRLTTIARVTAPILFVTLLFASVFLAIIQRRSLEENVLYVVFVGLAALTVPHMLLDKIVSQRQEVRPEFPACEGVLRH
jgi:Brp/Blh family beta-carotene 15,15'-monooxygenase